MISLLSSDSSDSEDDEQIIEIENPCCRSGLYIAQTKLLDENGQRLQELGLFTSRRLRPGQFIGFYTGEWWNKKAFEKLKDVKKRNEYALQVERDLVLSPPIYKYGKPSSMKHPLSFSNEPEEFRQANSYLEVYNFCVDEIDVNPDSLNDTDVDFPACGLVVCRTIGKNKEILWNYGSSYPRRYNEGRSCKRPKEEKLEDPVDLFRFIPKEAVPLKIHKRAKKN